MNSASSFLLLEEETCNVWYAPSMHTGLLTSWNIV